MTKKMDMAAMLDSFEAEASHKHTQQVRKTTGDSGRAVCQITMTVANKKRLTRIAKSMSTVDGEPLSLSAFVRLATNEYIENHNLE
jgi:hypothetical protein